MFEINFIHHQRDAARTKWRLLIILCVILILAGIYFFLTRRHAEAINKQEQNAGQIENVILPGVSENDIKLLGVVIDENNRWALIAENNQNVVKIQKGDLLGKEKMRVEKITLDSVMLFSKEVGQKILKDKK